MWQWICTSAQMNTSQLISILIGKLVVLLLFILLVHRTRRPSLCVYFHIAPSLNTTGNYRPSLLGYKHHRFFFFLAVRRIFYSRNFDYHKNWAYWQRNPKKNFLFFRQSLALFLGLVSSSWAQMIILSQCH